MGEYAGEEQSRDASNERAEQDADSTQFGANDSASRDASYEEVRNRAHEIYLGRGGSEGDPVADWLEAERQVRGRSGKRGADDRGETDQRS